MYTSESDLLPLLGSANLRLAILRERFYTGPTYPTCVTMLQTVFASVVPRGATHPAGRGQGFNSTQADRQRALSVFFSYLKTPLLVKLPSKMHCIIYPDLNSPDYRQQGSALAGNQHGG